MHLINQNIKGLMEIESSIFNIHEKLSLCSENDNQNFYKKYISYLKIALEVEKNKINSLSFDDANDMLSIIMYRCNKKNDLIYIISRNDIKEMIYHRISDLLNEKIICYITLSENDIESEIDEEYAKLISYMSFSINFGYKYLKKLSLNIKNKDSVSFKYKYIFSNIYLEEYLLKYNSLEEKNSPKPSEIKIPYYKSLIKNLKSNFIKLVKELNASKKEVENTDSQQELCDLFLETLLPVTAKSRVNKKEMP